MDWQIRVALIIVGIGVIGFIFYDFSRRKKSQAQKQRLIDQMRNSADQIDRLGFDVNGVGNVRKAGDDVGIKSESSNSDSLETYSMLEENHEIQTSVEEPMFDLSQAEIAKPTEDNHTKPSPTEQMSLVDTTEEDRNKEPDLVFSLILRATQTESFKGQNFMPILLSQGLRHGDMGIFHRHAGNKQSNVLYSVANAINPGTFDIQNIQNFETPAFAFFMTVPGPTNPLMAYDAMVKTIQLLKKELGGQILDDTKSVFTDQTYHHQREVLQDYLFKQSNSK